MKRLPHSTPLNTGLRTAILVVLPFVTALGFAGDARANHLENCNGIWLEAEAAASCKVVPTEECEVECKPVSMEMVCSSRLTSSCESSCSFEADVDCRSGCEETCVPDCMEQEAQDQPPNCMGLCMSDCQMDCNTTCEGGACRSQCAQVCSSDCHEQCDKGDPEPVCEPSCATACWGSCEGRANVDCQLSCQSETFTQCETDVAQECSEQCETKGAAIFCDGQFVASAGDFDDCAADIEAEFNIHLEFEAEAEGSIDTDGNLFACSVARESAGRTWPLGLMTFLGAFALLRRRRSAVGR